VGFFLQPLELSFSLQLYYCFCCISGHFILLHEL
jgi:hypothetical protein